MTTQQRRELRKFEGQMVHVALANGSRLDDVSLVSARTSTLWVFSNGEDLFLPVAEVIDVWESQQFKSAA